MKRIVSACLEQTQRFEARADWELYKQELDKKQTRYVVVSEKENSDHSVTVQLKREYNSYPVGDYFNE